MPPDAANLSPRIPPGAPPLEVVPAPLYTRLEKFRSVLFSIFCLQVGLLLMAAPWTEAWPRNYFSALTPWWREIWLSSYFRGAISGLGLVNLGIALHEIFRLRRFARPAPEDSPPEAGVQ